MGAQLALAKPRSRTNNMTSTYGIRDTPGSSPLGPRGRPSSDTGAIAFATSLSRNRAPTSMTGTAFITSRRAGSLAPLTQIPVRRHQESGQRSAVKDEGHPPELGGALEGREAYRQRAGCTRHEGYPRRRTRSELLSDQCHPVHRAQPHKEAGKEEARGGC